REEIKRYNRGEGPGPNGDDLRWDMRGQPSSEWNKRVVNILLEKLLQKKEKEKWSLPERSDAYFADAIREKFGRVRTIWRAAQPRMTEDDELENENDVEERMIANKDQQLKRARMNERRYNGEEEAADAMVWEWLKDIVERLGEDGMSSEESSVEDEVDVVLRTKIMPWRRDISRELAIIDKQRLLDNDIY
ncbi:hypothetical protein BV22DRAFT_979951, partial [Leucogyrophana mollusca]